MDLKRSVELTQVKKKSLSLIIITNNKEVSLNLLSRIGIKVTGDTN